MSKTEKIPNFISCLVAQTVRRKGNRFEMFLHTNTFRLLSAKENTRIQKEVENFMSYLNHSLNAPDEK